jgi:hypothetical protein
MSTPEDILNNFIAQNPNLSRDELQQKIIDQANANAKASEKTYADGVIRMIDEGLELAGKIIHYMRINNERLSKLDRKERKRVLLEEQSAFITFAQVHPIVFEYISSEQVFNRSAFKQYIRAGWGSPKSFEDQELIAKDKRNQIYLQNKKHALYYKYLLQETNKHIDKKTINQMYTDAVAIINKDTKEFLDHQDELKKQLDRENKKLDEEKKQELIAIFKKNLMNNSKK